MKRAQDELSDEELMALYQKDQIGAFDILYRRYADRIFGYLIKKSKSEKLAQDLLQEVFLKLHKSRTLYNQQLAFAPWIFTISRSVFLDSVKRRSLEDITEPKEFDKFHAPVAREKNGEQELLNALPETQKQAVSLRVFDEATFEEIATRLSTSPQNARQLLSRGLKKLKSTLTGEE